jgi:hypothetical protein
MGTHETLDVVKYIQCLVLKNIKKHQQMLML